MASIKVELLGDATSLERAFLRGAKASGQLKVGLGGVIKTAAAITGITVGIRALGNVLTTSVSAAGDFQLALQKTVGLSGVAQSAIKGLRNDVLQLGPAVGKGPQELADALFFITSSGIPAAKALDVLTVSAKASAAGLGETQVVADAVTSALNSYGPAVLSATQATDVLVATVREGKGEADQFAGVIGNVAAIAAQLGVSFDQVGAALAAQTRLGTDAETSATQLQRVFGTFTKITPQSRKAFESVGLDADKLRNELAKKNGLLTVLEQVRVAFGSNLPAEAKAFGDVRALRGVLALVGKQADATRGIFNRLAGSTGSLKAAFDAVSKTQAQQFARLSASVDTLKIALGAALAPAILKVVVPLNRWLSVSKNQKRVQEDITKTVKAVVGTIQDLVAAIKPLVVLTKDAADALGGFKTVLKSLLALFIVSKVVNFTTAITGIGTAASGSTTQVRALRLALLRLSLIGAIAIPIEIIINRKAIEDKVDSFLESKGLGFLTGQHIKISPDVDLGKLQALRDRIAGLKGENDLMVKALDKVIDRIDKAHGKLIVNQSLSAQEHGRAAPTSANVDTANKEVATQATKSATDAAKKVGATFSDQLQKVFQTFDVALAKAQLTPALKDDVAVLQKELGVINSLLAKHKNNLDLQQRQVEIQGQILDLQKQQKDAIKEQRQEQARILADAKSSARTLFGSFFQAAETEQQQLLRLGGAGGKIIQRPGTGAGDLLGVIKTQNQGFSQLLSNINKLVKEGAPGSLVKAAREGQISPEQVAVIANASAATRNRIFGQVRRSDRLIAQAAKAEINAKSMSVKAGTVNIRGFAAGQVAGTGRDSGDIVIHTHTHIDGKQVESSLERRAKKRAGQRRGRFGGKR